MNPSEVLLDAIKNQRWFFFKNKPKIIFDKDTGYIWANPNYFPYKKSDGDDKYNSGEVESLIQSINTEGIDGYTNWEIPNKDTLIIFSASHKEFFYRYEWFVTYRNKYKIWNLDSQRYSTFSSGCVIPFNVNRFPQYREPSELINFFDENNLEPNFDDKFIDALYKNRKHIFTLSKTRRISNVDAEKSSLVKYAESIQNLTEKLLNQFNTYTRLGAEIFAELKKLSPPNELVPDVAAVRGEIEKIRDDALQLEKSLLAIDNLARLADLNAVQRPPVDLVESTLNQKIARVFDQVEFFLLQENFVRSACAALNTKFEFEGEYLKQFQIKDRVAQKILVNLIRYVKAGHLQQRQEINTPIAAEFVL
ncbi:MAG: hypothetical protein IJS29_05465, partial [Selenomonadaceae bacterium]|nr:hypothetical protein [Selenomonadaceae bacterium]